MTGDVVPEVLQRRVYASPQPPTILKIPSGGRFKTKQAGAGHVGITMVVDERPEKSFYEETSL
jgi:hypothetical protein